MSGESSQLYADKLLKTIERSMANAPGLSQADISQWFAANSSLLRLAVDVTVSVLRNGGLPPTTDCQQSVRLAAGSGPVLEIHKKYKLTELDDIGGQGGMGFQVTEVRLGSAVGYVREGLAGDRFLINANERLGMGRGQSINGKLRQVLYLAAPEPTWDAMAQQIRASEECTAEQAGAVPRPVARNRRWTLSRAQDMIRIHLERIAAGR